MSIVTEIRGHDKDLGGGFKVRRLLPSLARQAVGPFVFFDHFGPVTVAPDSKFDVRPHPHIGLATVTYLLEGAMTHRDSLATTQRIEPGAVNWMTAGRGIVHSERRPSDLRDERYVLHGLQLWAALPRELEDCAPAFSHTPAALIPACKAGLAEVRVLVGTAFGLQSPVPAASETLYLSVQLAAGGTLVLPTLAPQTAVYPVDGEIAIDGRAIQRGVLAVLRADRSVRITASLATTVIVIGGAPPDARRHMWWNFVSSRKERIDEAAEAWAAQRMGRIEGDEEFIPLPERRTEL